MTHPQDDPTPPAPLTVHLVGHAHIDPVWLWDWREGVETVRATVRSALDRLTENPDMVFAHSSAAQYAWLERFPELLAEVRAAVTRGQWEPVGGWWVEPDANLPHGESFARQALHGQRTLERVVGRRATVGFLPDSFGHPATLPQLLALSGLTSFVFMRPSAHELELPQNLFRWVGPDGTSLPCVRIEAYSSNPHHVQSSLERNLRWHPPGARHWLGLYGVGNHGGGPTKRAIANLRALNDDPAWPALQMDSFEHFFDLVRAQEAQPGGALPEYAGELQHHARGCYAAVSEIKRLVREAERRLIDAERLAVLAGPVGHPYPHAALTRAWERVLFNQFHDVLAGSSIRRAYDAARAQLGEALAVADETEFFAMQAIAARIDTRRDGADVDEVIRSVRWDGPTWVSDYGDGVPVVVFNSSARPRRDLVEVEINDWHTDDLTLTDETGREVPYQRLDPESVSGGRPRMAFLADVPAGGYRLYRALAEAPAPVADTGLSVTEHPSGDVTLENAFLRVEFSARSGAVSRIVDKARDLELLAGHAGALHVVYDGSDTWGHGMTSLRGVVGLFGGAQLRVVERGPLRATVRVTTRWGASTAVQDVALDAHSAEIHGRVVLDWHEPHHAAQLSVPLALSGVEATFEVPYGHVVRPADGQEEPVGRWLDVSGVVRGARGRAHPAGAALTSDCKASASVLGGEVRLTLARSPIYAHHDPARPDPQRDHDHIDQGRQETRWALCPHAGDWRAAGIPERAGHVGRPMPLTREYVHPGDLPPRHSLLQLDGLDGAAVSAVKRAEDGDAVIVRLHEWAGRGARGTLHWDGTAIPVDLRPHQILSLRVEPGGAACAVNFLEEPL
ncbi:alpha-mannosidase [Deinococcus metalli]|uniref:Alpha-mannosidase n=1 Tax=Deinococcus metalli TaxID=1141878 RepID=A0A7W8KGW3_9DEIO|nr:alpha-mannosidase [Deinococcus metalli]MBB5377979.1 alpha-mannosidase [Deinococcus metalli]GHF53508.1 alpha-mannosidase [Deinococcus metalli]